MMSDLRRGGAQCLISFRLLSTSRSHAGAFLFLSLRPPLSCWISSDSLNRFACYGFVKGLRQPQTGSDEHRRAPNSTHRESAAQMVRVSSSYDESFQESSPLITSLLQTLILTGFSDSTCTSLLQMELPVSRAGDPCCHSAFRFRDLHEMPCVGCGRS